MTKSKISLKAGKLFIIVVLLFVTIPAFAQSVDTAWVRRYDGPGNSDDRAFDIAVDGSGNVYVTGYSYGNGTYEDYATVKYYPNGDTAWVKRFNGAGDSSDAATAIAVDESGNVYVTGVSSDTSTSSDYVTVKYNPDGDELWVRRYNGPGNKDDYAYAIAVDGSGDVYVSGVSADSMTSADYATIKYYSNGDTAWVRRYNGPDNLEDGALAIAVDDSSNVYVTGVSADSVTSRDYTTIKYDPNGNELWVRRYNGPGNDLDLAYAVAVDGSGNVYVTGMSTDSLTSADYVTIKYGPDGNELWLKRYNLSGFSEDWAYAIAIDGSSNVYVTGWSWGNWTYYDYATIKYYPNGDTAWVRRYNGTGSHEDRSRAIALDDSGNVYVTGVSVGGGTHYDYATVRYDPAGKELWVRRYNGPGNKDDYAYAIAVDGSGNVYVSGFSWGSGTDYDYATIKYIQFLRGDVNGDGIINLGDVVYLISYLYKGGPSPNPLQAGDCNCDGIVNLGDVVYLISYLYKGGPAPSC